MSLPITSQVIDHLKSLGFDFGLRHSSPRPGEVIYDYDAVLSRSETDKKLGVVFKDNRAGNPALFILSSKYSSRGERAFCSFIEVDDLLGARFERALKAAIDEAEVQVRLQEEASARAKENAARAVAVARQLADLLRSLGVSVDVEARNLSGRIGGREASVIVTGAGAYVSFGAHGFVEVGRSVASDLPAVAAKVAAFVAALEAAK